MTISTKEQQRVIALASGALPPETGMEKHFVAVLNGKGRACSPKEKAWVEYWHSHGSRQSILEDAPDSGRDAQALPVEEPAVAPVVTDCLSEFDTPPDLAFEDEVIHEEVIQLLDALLNKQPSDQSVFQQLVHIHELLKTAHAALPPRIARQLEAAEALAVPF